MSRKGREETVTGVIIESVHQRRMKHMVRVRKQLSNIKDTSVGEKNTNNSGVAIRKWFSRRIWTLRTREKKSLL